MDKHSPTLFEFPNFEKFVILDIETTGLGEEAQPFQISALKVESWEIVEVGNWFAKASLEGIPYTLSLSLRLDEIKEKIENAPPLEKVLSEFSNFVGDLPLVAHNAWFDLLSLRRYLPSFTNPFLDSVELFLLAFPLANSFALEELAKMQGIWKGEEPGEELRRLGNELGIGGHLHLHDALTDCLVLFLLLKKAVQELGASKAGSLLRHVVADADGLGVSLPPKDLREIFPSRTIAEPTPSESYELTKEDAFRIYDSLKEVEGWERRESQERMLREVCRIMDEGGIGMIEAPTGTGKTVAYALPAMVFSKSGRGKAIIATYSKHLQNQVVEEIEKKLLPFFPYPLRCVVVKGRGNYICLWRLYTALEDALHNFPAEVGKEEKFLLIYLARFVEALGDKREDFEALPYILSRSFPLLSSLKERVSSDHRLCRRNDCPFYDACFYQGVRRDMEEADIIVTNHWLLLLRKWDNPEDFNVVIDEAHNLEDVATQVFSLKVSKEGFLDLFNLLLTEDGKRGLLLQAMRVLGERREIRESLALVRDLREMLDRLGEALYSFLKQQGHRLTARYNVSYLLHKKPWKLPGWREISELLSSLRGGAERLRNILLSLQTLLQESPHPHLGVELGNVGEDLLEETRSLLKLLRERYAPEERARWINMELEGEGLSMLDLDNPPGENLLWALTEAPIRVGRDLEAKLYKPFHSLVLTSATLTLAGKGFRFFLDRLGLDKYVPDENLISLSPVFNYKENVLLGLLGYLPSNASQENIERFREDVCDELSLLIPYTGGRALVLFAARDRLEWVAERLEERLGKEFIPLYWQRRGASRRHILEEFRRREGSTLMGVRSFWEGVDVPGTSLCYLIIEKMPFPHIREPLVQARREDLRREGRDEYTEYLLPLALITFKQGFGRLMRKKEDKGVVVVLDNRLRYDPLTLDIVLQSLPGFKRTEEEERDRVRFYRAISEHMRDVFPHFPWEEKLQKVEERGRLLEVETHSKIKPWERIWNETEGKVSLLRLPDFTPLLDYALHRSIPTLFISPYNPLPCLEGAQRDKAFYLSPYQSIQSVSETLEKWKEGKVTLLAVHPICLEEDEVRRAMGKAERIILGDALLLSFQSPSFDPFLPFHLPSSKTITLLTVPCEEPLNLPFPVEEKSWEEEELGVKLVRGREILSLLLSCQERDEEALVYLLEKGEEYEKKWTQEGLLVRWLGEGLEFTSEDVAPILLLPPGRKVGKRVKYTIHFPPWGDLNSFLSEAHQGGRKEGFAISIYDPEERERLRRALLDMFPERGEIEDFYSNFLRRQKQILPSEVLVPKRRRILYLLRREGLISWRIIDSKAEVMLLQGEVPSVLVPLGLSQKRSTILNLQEASSRLEMDLQDLHKALYELSWAGKIFYRPCRKTLLVEAVRGRGGKGFKDYELDKQEIVKSWERLLDFVESLPFWEEG